MNLRKATGSLLLALLAAGPAAAQTSMGGVSGTITDSTGAVVPGATVLLTSEATNIRAEPASSAS